MQSSVRRRIERSAFAARVILAACCLQVTAGTALGQQPTDGGHASHHPQGSSGIPPIPPIATTAMMGEMGMGGTPQKQLYPTLMTLPSLSADARQSILTDARARMSSGLPLIVGGGEDIMRMFSAGDAVGMRDAAARVREGLSLFESGLSTQLAIATGSSPQTIALSWFNNQMNLQRSDERTTTSMQNLFGLSPGHITVMATLVLMAVSLLALQLIRLQRVQSILSRTAPAPMALSEGPPIGERATSNSLESEAPKPESSLSSETVLPPRQDSPRRAWRGILKVVQIVRETPSIKTFRLVEPSGASLPFDYLPGQFMTLEVEASPNEILKRAYTIASSPTRQAYIELTIKRDAQGKVSQFLHNQIKVGDLLKVSAPYGDLTFTGLDEDSIVLIGGGVGITPLMSVLRYLTDRVWPGEIYFLYSARNTEEFVFRDELAYLQRRHPNLHVLATMTRSAGTDWMGPEGQITKELLLSAVPDLPKRRIHVCGPPQMMTAMKEALTAIGVSPDKIHSEAFGPASLPADKLKPAAPTRAEAARFGAATLKAQVPSEVIITPAANTITFARSGKSTPLPAGMTVLEAAEKIGVEIPSSCRAGICGLCKVKLRNGSVTMEVEDALSAEDKAAGIILACQAKSSGSNLIVEA